MNKFNKLYESIIKEDYSGGATQVIPQMLSKLNKMKNISMSFFDPKKDKDVYMTPRNIMDGSVFMSFKDSNGNPVFEVGIQKQRHGSELMVYEYENREYRGILTSVPESLVKMLEKDLNKILSKKDFQEIRLRMML
jgi:predicted thioredoxin/glutaredoxin